jgi:signal transduction histidine kinase
VSTRRRGGDAILLEPIGWDGIEPAATADADAVVPLEYASELVGVIECGPKIDGSLDQRDHDLLTALARQAALALRHASLAADLTDQLELVQVQALELAESRERIVHAQDAERRRIQRDLHDGVQQHLVTLAANLRRATLVPTPDLAHKVHELAGDAEDTVFALQDFSNGIYPSVLSDEGLPAALWTHAQRLPVRVELDVASDVVGKRFGLEGEAALYFVAVEALVNAQKHASAERLSVRLHMRGPHLQLEIADDGRGLPPDQPRGLGLTNMKDRVAVLGGSLEIESRPGQGTRVIARVAVGQGSEPWRRLPQVDQHSRHAPIEVRLLAQPELLEEDVDPALDGGD